MHLNNLKKPSELFRMHLSSLKYAKPPMLCIRKKYNFNLECPQRNKYPLRGENDRLLQHGVVYPMGWDRLAQALFLSGPTPLLNFESRLSRSRSVGAKWYGTYNINCALIAKAAMAFNALC